MPHKKKSSQKKTEKAKSKKVEQRQMSTNEEKEIRSLGLKMNEEYDKLC